MEETNSEKTAVWVVVVGSVAAALMAVGDQLLQGGVLDQWPTAVVVVTALVSVCGAVMAYVKQRPGKHIALAEKTKAQAQLTAAEALNKSTPEGK